ncbi:hypothetical protein [Paenibacillus mucilaginosus]|uniref:hypothetical protein n=1 Tax=Paenibacillus mucilaginosus TaxID=61624 RepID=UPI0023786D1C|nr:hypothetical protein [Paenibacillus mucilaginosus]WDM28912.1 hypothetical protein KCX80_06840 [Paenibacillus mucilaginosus]
MNAALSGVEPKAAALPKLPAAFPRSEALVRQRLFTVSRTGLFSKKSSCQRYTGEQGHRVFVRRTPYLLDGSAQQAAAFLPDDLLPLCHMKLEFKVMHPLHFLSVPHYGGGEQGIKWKEQL